MAIRRSAAGSLTTDEKKVVKALLQKDWRNQDIQALLNVGRKATVNSARITEVKSNLKQKAASDEELEFFRRKKKSYDPRTGLNIYEDERLIRAREAMILAVQIFNSAGLNFKTQVFSVLAHIAWTYLLHEYYERHGTKIEQKDGRTLLLGQMMDRHDCPLSEGIRNNILALKTIRDDVEHKLLGRSDVCWHPLFQACCLNFENTICQLFGPQLSLASDLSFALQFAKMGPDHLSALNKFEIPDHVAATDARLMEGMTEEQLSDLEYRFRVVYTLDAASKSRANLEFVRPESAEGKEIRSILVHYKSADHLYPHKPHQVCKLVRKKSGKQFTLHNHTQAWHKFDVRPASRTKQPENTNKDFCIYHAAHRDYTYSDAWINFLVGKLGTEDGAAEIFSAKI
jgi:hypothetical protein